jgi:hypothetical protein
MHEKKPRPKPTEEEPAEKDKAWEKPQPDWLRCKVCNKAVKGEEALKMHMKTSSRCGAYRGESTRDPCPLCGKMISKGEWPEGLPCCREAKAKEWERKATCSSQEPQSLPSEAQG